MLRLIIFWLLVFYSLSSIGQTSNFGFDTAWAFNGKLRDYVNNIDSDTSGHIFICGQFNDSVDADPGAGVHWMVSAGMEDGFLIKLSPEGQLIWAKTFAGPMITSLYTVYIDPMQRVIVSGKFSDSVDLDPGAGKAIHRAQGTQQDMFVIALTNDGNYLWSKQFGSSNTTAEQIYDLVTDSAGNLFFGGYFAQAFDANPGSADHFLTLTTTAADAFLIKLDSNGDFLNGWNVGTDRRVYTIHLLAGSIPLVGGISGGSLNGYQIWVSRLRANGTTEWTRLAGSTAYDAVADIVSDEHNQIYVTGLYQGTVAFGTGITLINASSSASFLWKLSDQGVTLWAKHINGPWSSNRAASGVAMTLRGHYIYLLGNSTSVTTPNAFFAKFDTSGTQQFSTVFGSVGGTNYGYAIEQDKNGSIWIANNFLRKVDFCPGDRVLELTAIGNTSFEDMALIKMNPCNPVYDTLIIAQCDPFLFGKNWYHSSGTYFLTLANSTGCDSAVVLYLTIHEKHDHQIEVSDCDSFRLGSGRWVYNSGIFSDTLMNQFGCDSIVAYSVTLNSSVETSIDLPFCRSITINGTTYFDNVQVKVFETTTKGCDSITLYNYQLVRIDTGIILDGEQLKAMESGISYQWLNCDLNYQKITGAQNQVYQPVATGRYAVELTKNTCNDTTICMYFQASGIVNPEKSSWRIYPNPCRSSCYLESMTSSTVQLSDIRGNLLFTLEASTNTRVQLPNLCSGIYILSDFEGRRTLLIRP